MKAVILAGGAGTRLRPITYEIPKPLIPVKKKPIINHLVEFLSRYGVDEVGVLVSRGHEADFESWLSDCKADSTKPVIRLFYEEKPRGTFGGLEYVRDWLGTEAFIVTNGDELKDFNLSELVDFHKEQNRVATLALLEVPNPEEYGVPVLDGHVVTKFLEKPNPAPSNFINSGLYVLNPEVLSYADFSNEKIMFETDIFPKLATQNNIVAMKMRGGRWYDCGNLERWERAIKEW